MWNLDEATEYIRFNAIDNEDFLDADDDNKLRMITIASRTLTRKYSGYTIPESAVYLFSAVLAMAYLNDTNKMSQQGVASFSVKGIAITFKDWAKKGIDGLITDEVKSEIGVPSGRQAKWTVM